MMPTYNAFKWNAAASSMLIQSWSYVCCIWFCPITPTNLGQISKPVSVLETAGPDNFKTPPTCQIWPSFGWDNGG